MSIYSEDTNCKTKSYVIRRLSEMAPEQRLSRMIDLCQLGRDLMRESIERENPSFSKLQKRYEFARRLHGAEFVERFLKKED